MHPLGWYGGWDTLVTPMWAGRRCRLRTTGTAALLCPCGWCRPLTTSTANPAMCSRGTCIPTVSTVVELMRRRDTRRPIGLHTRRSHRGGMRPDRVGARPRGRLESRQTRFRARLPSLIQGQPRQPLPQAVRGIVRPPRPTCVLRTVFGRPRRCRGSANPCTRDGLRKLCLHSVALPRSPPDPACL